MLFALLENNIITRVGYTHELWPDVGFPADGPSENWLVNNNARKIISYKPFSPDTETLNSCEPYIENDKVYNVRIEPASLEYIEERKQAKWCDVRATRDKRMSLFEWRYNRFYREQRLGIPTTDNISELDAYMQALANITEQTDPYSIVWPQYE